MKVLFKGKSMISNEVKQLTCDINNDRYHIKDYNKRLIIAVNNQAIAIDKESFVIEILEGDSVANL